MASEILVDVFFGPRLTGFGLIIKKYSASMSTYERSKVQVDIEILSTLTQRPIVDQQLHLVTKAKLAKLLRQAFETRFLLPTLARQNGICKMQADELTT